jgi:hypothetical protein
LCCGFYINWVTTNNSPTRREEKERKLVPFDSACLPVDVVGPLDLSVVFGVPEELTLVGIFVGTSVVGMVPTPVLFVGPVSVNVTGVF